MISEIHLEQMQRLRDNMMFDISTLAYSNHGGVGPSHGGVGSSYGGVHSSHSGVHSKPGVVDSWS